VPESDAASDNRAWRAGRDCCSPTNGAVCSHPADSRRAIELDKNGHRPPRRPQCRFARAAL